MVTPVNLATSSVTVNGVTVAVSTCDNRTYQGTLIRGREMIHLGALKALGAELQTAANHVRLPRSFGSGRYRLTKGGSHEPCSAYRLG